MRKKTKPKNRFTGRWRITSMTEWDQDFSISAASILTDVDSEEQEAIVELDEKTILQAAKEIRARHAEKRAKHQAATTVKPQNRTKKQRQKATRLIHGDCCREMKKLRANSVDLILTDPPYPEIDREYGKLTEAEWHELMQAVVTEGRRVFRASCASCRVLASRPHETRSNYDHPPLPAMRAIESKW